MPHPREKERDRHHAKPSKSNNMQLYTTAVCPTCGSTFNKHINARYCSPRCAKKAGRDRRLARFAGPTTIDAYSPDAHRADFLGPDPLDYGILATRCHKMLDAYNGKTTPTGRVTHGGGQYIIDVYSPEAIGGYHPTYPIIRRERPAILDGEKPTVSMGHWSAFGDEDPRPTVPTAHPDPDLLSASNTSAASILNKILQNRK